MNPLSFPTDLLSDQTAPHGEEAQTNFGSRKYREDSVTTASYFGKMGEDMKNAWKGQGGRYRHVPFDGL